MATPFQTEAWAEYALGVVVLLLRYFARWKVVGFKGWDGDDYFAVATLVFWTAELCMLELIGRNGTNIGVTDEIGATLSDAEIAKLELGSKCLLAGWNFYVTLIWCLKGCMLCFYNRITLGLKQQKVVKWAAVGCALAYVGVIAVIWTHCTPVQKNWQVVPYPGDSCTLAVPNYVTLVVLNMTTDFVLVCIPLPLLWTVKLSIGRKLGIGVLLCSGVFIMVAALLRCILSLRDIEGINVSTIWAIRETFVGIIAVNAASIRPLFSRSRWLKSSKGYDSSGNQNGNSNSHRLTTIKGSTQGGGMGIPSSKRRNNKTMTALEDNSSEEHIIKESQYGNAAKTEIRAGSTASNSSADHHSGIMVTTTYEVNPYKSRLSLSA